MRADRVAGTGLILFGLLVLWQSRALPLGSLRNPGPAYLPVVLALLIVLFGVLIAGLGGSSPTVRSLGWSEAPHMLAIVVACVFAALALERIGYRLTMIVMLFFLLRGMERRRTVFSLAFSVALASATFYLFSTILRVPLPRGPLGI